MTQTGKEWLGLSGARRLVASSVQDWQPLPVLWNGRVPERGRRRLGEALQAAMTEIHFPEHLPAILIGVNEDRAAMADALPWAHTVHHQHGGYACLQSHFYGILLPLSAVPDCSALMRGFDALAHDSPTPSAFEQVPELESLHLTHGKPYDSAAIHVLQRFLARADFDFPAVTGGTEALLEFSAAQPAAFLGWPVLMLEMPDACPLHDPDARDLAMGPLGIYPGKVLSQQALACLQEIVGEQLRVYLHWNNSD